MLSVHWEHKETNFTYAEYFCYFQKQKKRASIVNVCPPSSSNPANEEPPLQSPSQSEDFDDATVPSVLQALPPFQPSLGASTPAVPRDRPLSPVPPTIISRDAVVSSVPHISVPLYVPVTAAPPTVSSDGPLSANELAESILQDVPPVHTNRPPLVAVRQGDSNLISRRPPLPANRSYSARL